MKKLTPQEQAKRIAARAQHLAARLDVDGHPPRLRRSDSARLDRALKALDRPKWRLSTLQLAVLQGLDSPAGFLKSGKISAATAEFRATTAITNAMSDRDVPNKLRGKVPPREDVLACLASWHRKGGRMPEHAPSKYDAALALLKALGIARPGAGASAIRRLMQRKAQARRARAAR